VSPRSRKGRSTKDQGAILFSRSGPGSENRVITGSRRERGGHAGLMALAFLKEQVQRFLTDTPLVNVITGEN